MSNIATPSSETILNRVGIRLRHYGSGVTRMPCPRCSPHRKAHHRHLKCLTVEIRSDDSVVWCCHHPGCGFSGPKAEHVKGLNGENSRPMLEHRPASREGNSRETGSTALTWEPMIPPPGDHVEFRPPLNLTALYRYHDGSGRVLCYVSRRDLGNGKDILPHTYGILNGRPGWYVKRGNPPLPLYGLRYLALAPVEWDVILVEGEKAADALNKQLRIENFAAFAMTWMGGCDCVKYADWSPLAGRNVIRWPDADGPGIKAMVEAGRALKAAGAHLAGNVRVHDLPDGFDAADLTTSLEQFFKERCR